MMNSKRDCSDSRECMTIRLLKGEKSEMMHLQRVIEEAPKYFENVTGVPPGPAEAQSMYTVLPEGKSYEDKFVYGVYREEEMIGCVDLIRGYPNEATAYIGLLLISEKHQRKGTGRLVFRQIEESVLGWKTCDKIRLAVVRTNEQAIFFWKYLGFKPTGETKPYHSGSILSESIIFEKSMEYLR